MLTHGPLLARSRTTSLNPPESEEYNSYPVGREVLVGHVDVPEGVYRLERVVWKDGMSTAFRLTGEGSASGRIDLRGVQLLRVFVVGLDKDGKKQILEEESRRQSRWYKSECYLHPSPTFFWSHGDSHGCLNLYQPRKPRAGQPSDWQTFLTWLQEEGLEELGEEPMLLVTAFENVADNEMRSLVHTLPGSIAPTQAGGVRSE